jgi:hypothetical protein
MTCRSYRSLLFVFLLMFTAFCAKAQNVKNILLNHVDSIPMPPKPNGNSFFFLVNDTPQIIAMMQPEFGEGQKFRAGALVASTLGKGKVLLFGSPAYFRSAMLQDKAVAQLLNNAMSWAKPGNKSPRIAVSGNMEKDIKTFMAPRHADVYTTTNFEFKKNTDVLMLTHDVTDTAQLKHIEDFIVRGGTLLFSSPYSDIYNSKDSSSTNTRRLDLGINKLLAKAGLNSPNVVVLQTPDNAVLLTDSVPDYLAPTTMLRFFKDTGKPNNNGINTIVNLSLDVILKYSPSGSPYIKRLKQTLNIPLELPMPSRDKPVLNNTAELKASNQLAYSFYGKQQDFDHHPEAKALGYNLFPGDVAAGAPRVTETVTIPVKVGTQGLYDMPSVYYRPHSTGLYIPAGEKVKITIGNDLIKQHLRAQIGVHDDNILNLDELKRIPLDLTATFVLEKESIDVYSPYGGLLLINIPDTCTLKTIKVNVSGAVKAPYFKLGETTEQDWNTSIRNNPAPWAELATDNIVLTVPSYRIRQLSNPVKLMQFWDEVMDADADLAIISRKRVHQERLIIDEQVYVGSMYALPNKLVGPDDENCGHMLDEAYMRANGLWGHFHEIGHRHQFFDLDMPGTTEVTVNLYTMYVFDKVLHKGLYNHEGMENMDLVVDKIKAYLANDPNYEKWQKDPFLALSMYIQIIDQFGWDAIKNANVIYRNLPKDKYPKTDQDRRDLWFTTICKTTNSNLGHFFDVWKIPVSETAKKQAVAYKSWFPKALEGN